MKAAQDAPSRQGVAQKHHMSPSEAGCVCVNGRFFEPGNASVSVFDAGFLVGDGLFESLRALGDVPYLLNRHLVRLFSAAAAHEFANMPSLAEIGEQVHETLRRAELAEAYVRVTVTRGTGAVGLAPPKSPPTVVIAALPAPARADRGLEATLLPHRRHVRARAKSTSWQHVVQDRRCVDALGADEGIYVSASAHVLEGVASNVFAVKNEQLLTPSVSECLPGITRGRVLELTSNIGVTAVEAPLEVDAVIHADEVFVTSAVQGLRAVRAIAGSAIGRQGTEGVFDRLRLLYEEDRALPDENRALPSGPAHGI